MAQVAIATLTKDGLEMDLAAFQAAAADDYIVPGTNKSAFVIVNNDSAGVVEVTIPAYVSEVYTVLGGTLAVPDIVQNIPAGDNYIFGPFPSGYVNEAGRILIQYDSITDVNIAAYAVGQLGS